ncbi:MAPEG family protein [Variovorax sp. VNK109]|uniref:MAPEG family protein n=1 Tax=Variovorax sp. VNK109 TaxID=3400919 RepID=UPI003C103244
MNTHHFTFAYWCLLVAALLPFVCAGIAKYPSMGRSRHNGGYDNVEPRAWKGKLTGWQARADAAQANSFEGLPFFIGAVIVAHQLGANQALVDLLSFAYVLLRLIYIALYVGGFGNARSAVWALGFFVNIAILFVGYR